MTRAEKIAKAQELRAQGLKHREIAEQLGVTQSCITKWLNPDAIAESRRRDNAKRYERKREWDRTKGRGVCVDCGGWTYRKNVTVRCESCENTRQHESHALRDRQIEAWWNEGLSLRQIGDRLGWTAEHVGVEVHRLRGAGYNLPYRHKFDQPRFPGQVAA